MKSLLFCIIAYQAGQKRDRWFTGSDLSPAETTAALENNRSLLETSAQKVAQIKSINEIETGKTFLGGKVTLSKEDYGTLSDLAKKQIAAENKENELTAEIAKLKKENEQATEKIAYLDQEVSTLRPMKFALKNAERERDSLKAKLQRIMEFIEKLNLKQKLEEFLKPKTRGIKH